MSSIYSIYVIDVTRTHTHTKVGGPNERRVLKAKADAKYRKHTQPYRASTLPSSLW